MKRSISYLLSVVLVFLLSVLLLPGMIQASSPVVMKEELSEPFVTEPIAETFDMVSLEASNPKVADLTTIDNEDVILPSDETNDRIEEITRFTLTEESSTQESQVDPVEMTDPGEVPEPETTVITEPSTALDELQAPDNPLEGDETGASEETPTFREESPKSNSPVDEQETSLTDETQMPDSTVAIEEPTTIEDVTKSEHSLVSEEPTTPTDDLNGSKETTDSETLTDGEELTDSEDPSIEDEDTKTQDNLLTTRALSAQQSPQFIVEVRDGHLLLREASTGVIRKDNKWVIDSVTGQMYFPNAQGYLYHDQFITFGPAMAYYLGSDGSKQSNRIVEFKNNLHLLNPDGLLNKSNRWTNFNSKIYFPNADGRLYRDQFISFGPAISYFMGSDGSRQSNRIVEFKNNLHLLNPDGLLNKSNRWANFNSKIYFPNADGRLYRDQFISFGPAISYFMGSDGSRQSNRIVEVNNNLHLLNPDGLLNKSNRWANFNSKIYFPNADGRLYRDQFISFGPAISYFMGSDGSRQSNRIVEVNNNLHLLNPNGLLNKSNQWTNFNGKQYFPNDQGKLYRNQFLSFGPSIKYYLDNGGAKVTGQHDVNGINYTFDSTGRFVPTYRGWTTLKNQLYYFATNGFPTTGWFNISNRTYHSDTTGIVSKGVKTINRNVYYFDVRPGVQYPKMVRNEKLSFGSYIYYFNQDGIGIRLSNAPLGSRQDGTYLTNKNFILTIKNGLATIDGTLIVNKTFTLPSTYNPGLTYSTQTAFNTMRNAMNNQGLSLWIASGFRSYATQSQLFQQYVDAHGVAEAETFSARAGHSEHQSGLAMDVNSISDSFAYTNEGIWLHNNAWRHGFILRYPRNKQGVTGYIYEPWHFRYVGYDLARKLYNNGSWLTVEEYFGIPSHY